MTQKRTLKQKSKQDEKFTKAEQRLVARLPAQHSQMTNSNGSGQHMNRVPDKNDNVRNIFSRQVSAQIV
jgi:hypothetical protein